MKRFTKYQNRLRGSAFSELSKIWARQEGRMSSASVPTKVPKVKTTYPLTKLVASKTSLCKTLTNPNETEAMRIEDKISRWFSLSEKNIKNPPPTSSTNPSRLPRPKGCRSKPIAIRPVATGENPPMMAKV